MTSETKTVPSPRQRKKSRCPYCDSIIAHPVKILIRPTAGSLSGKPYGNGRVKQISRGLGIAKRKEREKREARRAYLIESRQAAKSEELLRNPGRWNKLVMEQKNSGLTILEDGVTPLRVTINRSVSHAVKSHQVSPEKRC